MIEANAFLVAFALQILSLSVLHPAWLIKYVRVQAMNIPAERFAQLYPDVDRRLTLERYLTLYRVLNLAIAMLGLLLLGWLFSYTRRPAWDGGGVKESICAYYVAQLLPIVLAAWIRSRHNKLLEHLLEGKRKAILQRRGLFDFVSPFAVFLAVLGYFLIIAQVIYVQKNLLSHIVIMTLIFSFQAFMVYRLLNSKKVDPHETHAARLHTIGLGVKTIVYTCIAIAAHKSIKFTLIQLDLQRWEPFALSILFVFSALVLSVGLTTRPHRPDSHEAFSDAIRPQPPVK